MTEGHNKSWKYWVFRIFLPGLMALMVLLYLGLALMPTGFQEYEASHAGAVTKVNGYIGVGPQSPAAVEPTPPPAAPQPPQPPKAQASAGGARLRKVFPHKWAFVFMVRRFEKFVKHPKDREWFERIETPYDPYRREFGSFRHSSGAIAWHETNIPQEEWDPKSLALGMDLPAKVRARILSFAQTIKPRPEDFPDGVDEQKRPIPEAEKAEFDRMLDMVESFLLDDEWIVPDFDRFPRLLPMNGLSQLTALAMLRAAGRQDHEKAARLLERWTEAKRLIHLGRFPYHYNNYYNSISELTNAPLLISGECGPISPSSMERLGKIFDRSLLNRQQLTEFTQAVALRDNRIYRQGDFPKNDNAWHHLLHGYPEGVVSALIEPLATRLNERLILGWNDPKEDPRRRGLYWNSMLLMTCLMNTDDQKFAYVGDIVPINPLEYVGAHGEDFNREIHLARLILATAAYRRERGHYPESTGELIPQYLPPAFRASPEIGLEVLRLGTGPDERPVFCHLINGRSGGTEYVFVQIGVPVGSLR